MPANAVLKQEIKEMTEAGNANQQTLQNQETNEGFLWDLPFGR